MFHIFCMVQNIVNFIVPSNLPLTSATFMEKNFPDWDPVFCQVSGFCTSSGDTNLKIGWIMQWSTRNSKMEFANHFFKIHAIAFSQFSTNRTHIARNERQTILSSFFDDEWWVSTKMNSKLLSFHFLKYFSHLSWFAKNLWHRF